MQPRAQQRRRTERPAMNSAACAPRPSGTIRRERFEVLLRARRRRSSIPGYTTLRSSSTRPGYRSIRGAKQDSKPRLDGLERVQDVEVVNS